MSSLAPSLDTAQALAGTAVASTSAGLLAWISPFTAIGIPAAVVFMSLTGTAAGLIFNPPGVTRRRMFGLAFVYTAVSASAAMVIGEIPGFAFFKTVAPAMGLLLAFFAQTLLPVAREALAARVKRLIGGAK